MRNQVLKMISRSIFAHYVMAQDFERKSNSLNMKGSITQKFVTDNGGSDSDDSSSSEGEIFGRSFFCKRCGEEFPKQSHLDKHARKVHPLGISRKEKNEAYRQEKLFLCAHCEDFIGGTQLSLDEHVEKIHHIIPLDLSSIGDNADEICSKFTMEG